MIEGWRVQFPPVASELDEEALAQADEAEITMPNDEGTVRSRVLLPAHIVATALRVARPKDLVRIAQFMKEEAVDPERLRQVLVRHGLTNAWLDFCRRTGI